MANIHITLVGGQSAPIYNGIVATSPDKVIFICSNTKESHRSMEAVKNEIDVPSEVQIISPTDPQEIISTASLLAKQYTNDTVVVNITSGLKSWSHLFGRVFEAEPNASIVYMDQNNVLWNYRTMQSSTNFVFDMDVLFRLQGNALTHYVSYSEYTEEDKNSLRTLEAARRYNCGSFNKLTTLLSKEWNNKVDHQKSGCLEISEENYVEWEKPDFVRLTLSTKKSGIKEFTLESPHAVNMAFHTHWFEYKIAQMLSHWKYAKDIRLNCIFPPQNTKSIQFPKNEVDIIVNTGTKILFVECKTQIANSTDIDKFRTAVKNYGGMGSKALFITDNPMDNIQKEKCKESSIINFALQDPQWGTNKEQELFRLLEQELFNINTK